jgi:hypothetical protein
MVAVSARRRPARILTVIVGNPGCGEVLIG